MDEPFQIAIDGPVGAGKSTVAKAVADQLNFTYIDTGAMYRVATLIALENQLNINDESTISSLVSKANIKIKWQPKLDNGIMKIWVDDREVTGILRTKQIDQNVAQIASLALVRKALVNKQKQIASTQNIIMEGRDIGIRVLPNAKLKIYLDADERVRIERRFDELKSAGLNPSMEGLTKRVRERDEIDKNRSTDPLKPTKDSWVLDTTKFSIGEVVSKIIVKVKKLQA